MIAERVRSDPRGQVVTRWVPVVLAAALSLPLLVYSSVGAFSRYTADDFCWAGVLRTDGFFEAQKFWYTEYSPRYAFTFLVNLTELAGPAIVPVLPVSAIVCWLAILTWTLKQFRAESLRALVVAEVVALSTLQTAPDLPQSLYWQTGMLTYLLPLMLATFVIGWIRRGSAAWWAIMLSAGITFVAGGLSETYLIPQNVALTLALLVSFVWDRTERGAWLPRRQPLTPRTLHLAAALVGGVLALVVIVVAPSTASRVGGTPANIWLALSASIATGYYQVVHLVRFSPFTVLLTLAVPALLSGSPFRITRGWFAVVTLVVCVTLPFCYFPSFYAQNGNPPARSLIVPGAMLIAYLVFVGFGVQSVVAERLPEVRRSVALAALVLVPLSIAIVTFPDQADAARYATVFDAEDQQIRASRDAGQADLTVSALPPNLGEQFVTDARDNWFNMCVARYYGVRSIATP
jgi:hypothetical protein